MERSIQLQIQSYAVYLRISGILLLIGNAIKAIPVLGIIEFFPLIFFLASVIFLFLFLGKINVMNITNSSLLRISQISLLAWGCFNFMFSLILFITHTFAGIVTHDMNPLILIYISEVSYAIFQLGSFFFLDRILNDLNPVGFQLVKIKTYILLSFSFYGFISILHRILSVTLGFSPTSHPVSIVINTIRILLSAAVAIILIIISSKIGITEQVLDQDEPIIDSTRKPIKQFCSNCGARIEPSKTFCENCGLSLK